ncbi:hypothetical protein [Affinirhizobium pseudoryzae]|uniref:hypothetical protein n=1 Tax=Allorhizobium pseudoryzae TaxID=379684 RepID=UPI0013ED46B5|nr:hypothetical protein [Allorhizobium pseudoryzae]
MGVHPSTLIRALRTNAMSPDMTKAAQQFLNEFAGDPTGTPNELHEVLLLLQKLNKITPRLQAALEIALDGVQVVK